MMRGGLRVEELRGLPDLMAMYLETDGGLFGGRGGRVFGEVRSHDRVVDDIGIYGLRCCMRRRVFLVFSAPEN